ncbi:hypothetical protein [Gemmobacter denitrificans]|uniref:Uncharacterized protein n=1 Tax=Gemmobacter denitrificans TaxID=3123040 RepID=A0ABU8BTN9_9RHOB
MAGRQITAKQALRSIMSAGWKSDGLAIDAATDLLVLNGADEETARAEVVAAFNQHFKIMGPV